MKQNNNEYLPLGPMTVTTFPPGKDGNNGKKYKIKITSEKTAAKLGVPLYTEILLKPYNEHVDNLVDKKVITAAVGSERKANSVKKIKSKIGELVEETKFAATMVITNANGTKEEVSF